MVKLKNLNKEEKLLYLLVFIFIVLIVSLGIQLAMQRVPHEYTEAFLERNTIPKTVKLGESFTTNLVLTNVQGQELVYNYLITEGEIIDQPKLAGEIGLINASLVKKGSINLQEKETKTIPFTITLNSTGQKKITIKYQHEREDYFHTLYFWVTVIP